MYAGGCKESQHAVVLRRLSLGGNGAMESQRKIVQDLKSNAKALEQQLTLEKQLSECRREAHQHRQTITLLENEIHDFKRRSRETTQEKAAFRAKLEAQTAKLETKLSRQEKQQQQQATHFEQALQEAREQQEVQALAHKQQLEEMEGRYVVKVEALRARNLSHLKEVIASEEAEREKSAAAAQAQHALERQLQEALSSIEELHALVAEKNQAIANLRATQETQLLNLRQAHSRELAKLRTDTESERQYRRQEDELMLAKLQQQFERVLEGKDAKLRRAQEQLALKSEELNRHNDAMAQALQDV